MCSDMNFKVSDGNLKHGEVSSPRDNSKYVCITLWPTFSHLHPRNVKNIRSTVQLVERSCLVFLAGVSNEFRCAGCAAERDGLATVQIMIIMR